MSPQNSSSEYCKNGCTHAIDPVSELAVCVEGGTDCLRPQLLVAKPSKFHDQALIDATAKINEILEALSPDPEGRKVSLIVNKLGAMLAWVHHNGNHDGKYSVTSKSDDETLIKALKLKI